MKVPVSLSKLSVVFEKIRQISDANNCVLQDFDKPIQSWEQAAQKWHVLMNKRAAHYEEMRICEAERKHREHKAKTNGPPADSLTLTCSTCNLQGYS